jgi:hypothetical protein
MRGPRAVQSFGSTSHMRWSAARFVDAKDLRRPSSCEIRVHSEEIRGAIRCNQKDWRRPSSCNRLDRWFRYRQAQSETLRVMTCLQPGHETDGLDSDTVIDVLDHQEQP